MALVFALFLAALPATAQEKTVTLNFPGDLLSQIATDNQGEMTKEITGRILGLSPSVSNVRLRRASGVITLALTTRTEDGLKVDFDFSLGKMVYYRMTTAKADVNGMMQILQEAKAAEPLLLAVDYRYDERYSIIDLKVDLRPAIKAREEAVAKAAQEAKAAATAKAAAEEKAAAAARTAAAVKLAEEARIAAAKAAIKTAEEARLAVTKALPPEEQPNSPPPSPPPAAPLPAIYLAVKKLGREAVPTVDGLSSDPVWLGAQPYSFDLQGASGRIAVSMWGLWSPEQVWFLLRWPDRDRSDVHRPWIWSPGEKAYVAGREVEDALALAFARDGRLSDCMLIGHEAAADLWTWRAVRTNPAGYAEDGTMTLSFQRIPRANYYQAKNGRMVWVKETADPGQPSYQAQVAGAFAGERMPRYIQRTPSGSIADVTAKGVWKEGFWTVELSRKLSTGDPGDVVFTPNKEFFFSVAVFDHREGIDHSTSKEMVMKLE